MTAPWRILFLAALIALPSVPAAAQQSGPQVAPQPQGGEGMMVSRPQGWIQSAYENTPVIEEVIFEPEKNKFSRDRKDWLIYREVKGQGGADVMTILKAVVDGYRAAGCPGLQTGDFQKGMVDGVPSGFVLLACGNNPRLNYGQYALIKVMSGQKNVYQIHRLFYLPPFNQETPPLTSTEIANWVNFLARLRVCDPSDPQRPCQPVTQ